MNLTLSSLLLLTALASAPKEDEVGLGGVRAMEVIRTSATSVDVVLDIRSRTEPPCDKLKRDGVKIAVEGGRVDAIERGGARWVGYVSGGFPVPLPERRCKQAIVHIRDAREAMRIALSDDDTKQSWRIELQLPPLPACSWLEPNDGNIAPGQRARIRCDTRDVAAINPQVWLRVGETVRGARPALEISGGDIAFTVPQDWPVPNQDASVRVYFFATKPIVKTSNTPMFVSTQNASGLVTYRDLRVAF